MSNYVISDWHLYHKKILGFQKETRPFASVEEMNQAYIDGANEVCGPNDTLINLGDLALNIGNQLDKQFDAYCSIRNRLKCGKMVLYLGNHDIPRVPNLINEGFPLHNLFEIRYQSVERLGNQEVFFSHYMGLNALKKRTKRWVLFGHSHGNLDLGPYNLEKLPFFDCSIDNRYKLFGDSKPYSVHELAQIMKDKDMEKTIDYH